MTPHREWIHRGLTLSIRRPSPTTIAFTVSTKHKYARASPAASFLQIITWLLRLSLASLSILALYLTATSPLLRTKQGRYQMYVDRPKRMQDGSDWQIMKHSYRSFFIMLQMLSPSHIVATSTLCLVLSSLRLHVTETFLILQTLGVQVSSSSRCYLIPSSQRFIPTGQIQDILIHEAFRGFEVRHYLAIIVDDHANSGRGHLSIGAGTQKRQGDDRSIVVVFPKTLPALDMIRNVWRASRKCLYQEENDPAQKLEIHGR